MTLLGSAAVAMWWDIAPEQRAEFEDWHSHEHFPERMGIPGFLRGSRWVNAAGGEGFFILYELESYAALTSPAYLARLNAPTPWSTKMMPHHRNMVRSQCRVRDSFGGGVSGFVTTLRLSPEPGRTDELRDRLRRALAGISTRPGITGGHLLHTETPEAAETEEQRIRGGDAVADWIVLVSGYDARALEDLGMGELGAASLIDAGATPAQVVSLYRLSFTMTPNDI